MLDNVVSIMEHSVAHISHPSEAFLAQVETNVVRLMLSSSSSVIVQFTFFNIHFNNLRVFSRSYTIQLPITAERFVEFYFVQDVAL